MNRNDKFDTGKRIKQLRTEKGFSQEQLALCSNITPTYLGSLERGIKNPTIKVVEQICSALNVSLHDFFSGARAVENDIDNYSVQILAQLEHCSEEEKKQILRIIKEIVKLKNIK